MRILLGLFLLALCLSGCASLGGLPASQTLGLTEDPDRPVKMALVTTGLVVDAVAVYGKLPPCNKAVPQPLGCRKENAYRDAKLILGGTVESFRAVRSGSLTSLVMVAALGYCQVQLAKTLAAESGPTAPGAAPTPQTVAYITAIGAADVLISGADDRIKDGVSVNTSVADLLVDLEARVAALP